MELAYRYVSHEGDQNPDTPFHRATVFMKVVEYQRSGWWLWRREKRYEREAFLIKHAPFWRWLDSGREVTVPTSDLFDDFLLAAETRRNRDPEPDERPSGNVYRFPARRRR